MVVMRYSGPLVVSMKRYGAKYRCTVRAPHDQKCVIEVALPVTHAIDSPEAFDDAAIAALTFAYEEAGLEGAPYDENGVIFVGRKPEDAWP